MKVFCSLLVVLIALALSAFLLFCFHVCILNPYMNGGWWDNIRPGHHFGDGSLAALDPAWWQTVLYEDFTFSLFTVLPIAIASYNAIRKIAKSSL
jgi:hypothetical protein